MPLYSIIIIIIIIIIMWKNSGVGNLILLLYLVQLSWPGGSDGIATGYGLDGPGIDSRLE
jgi:hypothetical protein